MTKKSLQKLTYLEDENSFWVEIKSTVHHFWRDFSQANNTNFFGRREFDFNYNLYKQIDTGTSSGYPVGYLHDENRGRRWWYTNRTKVLWNIRDKSFKNLTIIILRSVARLYPWHWHHNRRIKQKRKNIHCDSNKKLEKL